MKLDLICTDTLPDLFTKILLNTMNNLDLHSLAHQYGYLTLFFFFVLAISSIILIYRFAFSMLRRLFRGNYAVSLLHSHLYHPGLTCLLVLFSFLLLPVLPRHMEEVTYVLRKILIILLIASVTFLLIRILGVVKLVMLNRFDTKSDDNLQARKVFTQFQILERVIIFVIILFAIALSLMTFESIRQIGVSLLASAGVLGIILGFAAQKSLSTIFAGIQIAIAQPIRVDDVVVVEGEWGRIEEIMLTYVTVRIWDNRRLIVPINYFLDKPFQNWTRISSQITGAVFLFVDYAMPIQPLRDELDRILVDQPLWDGQVKVLQVTDSTERAMQFRVLVSAENSAKAWDLRCYVREKLIDFMRQHYAEFLPKNRLDVGTRSPESHIPAAPFQRNIGG
jgi:small-conductance mechanosensitive channel